MFSPCKLLIYRKRISILNKYTKFVVKFKIDKKKKKRFKNKKMKSAFSSLNYISRYFVIYFSYPITIYYYIIARVQPSLLYKCILLYNITCAVLCRLWWRGHDFRPYNDGFVEKKIYIIINIKYNGPNNIYKYFLYTFKHTHTDITTKTI